MNTYVALLRRISVGGNCKVEMKKLATLFVSLGFEKVRTYINSGNVIFDGARVDDVVIERALEKEFGFRIPIVIRDKKRIMRLVRALPAGWDNNTEQKTDILFLWNKFDTPKSLALLKAVGGVDNLLYVPGSIVWNIARKNYAKSAMHAFIGTELYKHMTARNINTVRKMAALLEV